ncbi:glycosyltransferase family 4 protein [Paludisphaera rhizosphaerae]|uniref:glycosyltransferase family 4 protein n=1 Tax=Paludisphaera rhizosphaerae TaxID=2711216 RepID=UPI00197F36A3|nr:glycosyltransferase family 4 protein [Paludisphaera rhizosphaerae]
MTCAYNGKDIKILVITHLLLPDSCGGAPIFTDLCHGLAERRMEVTVRCAYPYYPEWTDKSGSNGLRIERESVGALQVERHGMFIPSRPQSIVQRIMYELSFAASLSRSLFRGGKYDAVVVFCPLAGSVAYAALHKLVHGTPVLLNVQDLPADAAAAGGVAKSRVVRGLLRFAQRILFNRADAWRTISPVMLEQLSGLSRRRQPLYLIPDWLHPTMAETIRCLPPKSAGSTGRPLRLFYSGNIGGKQGLLDFCKILQQCDADFEFRINGCGGAAAQVHEWVASTQDPRFEFGPLVDEPGFVRNLHEADLFVITEKPDKRASFFPSKSIPAMSSGTPILAVCSPDSPLGIEMHRHDVGPWFSWDDCDRVGGFLTSLSASPERLDHWRFNALKRSENYQREACLDRFEGAIRELVRAQAAHPVAAGLPRPTAVENV